MKFILKAVLIGAMTYVMAIYLPWWSIAIAAGLGGMVIETKAINSFLAGAMGVGIVWCWMAIKIDYETESLLTKKIAELIGLENQNLLIVITVLIGSLVGAFGAWTGDSFRKVFRKTKKSGYYS